jgi:hypothetical protein
LKSDPPGMVISGIKQFIHEWFWYIGIVNHNTMSDQHKLAILNYISSNATPGMPARISFNSIGKISGLSKQELDAFLLELNKQHFISKYAKKGVDSFTVVINQKGLDAIQDESFI